MQKISENDLAVKIKFKMLLNGKECQTLDPKFKKKLIEQVEI